jgi:hypothetical protein
MKLWSHLVLTEMSSGVSQKETCVHVVNNAAAMSLAEMPKISSRTKSCFRIRPCTERNNDVEKVPETVCPVLSLL